MIKRGVCRHPDLAKSFVWKWPTSWARGACPPPPTTPLRRIGDFSLSLSFSGIAGAQMRRESRVVRARRLQWPRQVAKRRSPRSHPQRLAEPLRGVLSARRAPLRAGAETSGAGRAMPGCAGGRAPGSARAHPPRQAAAAGTWPPPPRPPAPPRAPRAAGRHAARARTELSPRPPWRGRRAPANDGEGAARARRARPTPAAAL